MTALIVLGIDPGYALMGWGVIESEGGRMRLLGYGCISTKAGKPAAVCASVHILFPPDIIYLY